MDSNILLTLLSSFAPFLMLIRLGILLINAQPQIDANGSNKISFFTSSTSSYCVLGLSSIMESMEILLDLESDDCFLLNPVSMEKIMLPPLQYFPFFCCILSLPPTNPNCALIFVCREKSSAMKPETRAKVHLSMVIKSYKMREASNGK
ncbi:hypothetical protein HYC85_028723 [Camellia sinensis]|uniref:Uncharacterized protein n=1 Tax=Camellia sinensis TaxID=4442 RepID=A0A7J7FW33_CAMSI|nr:hypothetical protein HYC85_028723 [Camellia sinensis]